MGQTMTGRPYAPIAVNAPRMARQIRRPTHTAHVCFLPHQIVPFLVAPVLPGDTLKNFQFQARVLTTPLTGQLTGWWFETYWFYVKHRHLSGASTYLSMMLDLNASVAAQEAAGAEAGFQQTIGDLPFCKQAYVAVVNEFFRGDGEVWDTADGFVSPYSLARLKMPGWWDSILPENQLDTVLGGVADDTIGGAALDQVSEVARAIETYNSLRMLGVTNMEYDDWLRSFGVTIAAPAEDRPELLRYTREWQYPANTVTVDATAQRVSSVLSWSIQERADKDRFFKEPGVILACCVARPKLYHDRQQAGVGMLKDAIAWQTPWLTTEYQNYRPMVGMAGYVWDARDLFLHGDQWRFAQRGSTVSPIAFPSDGQFDYPTTTAINNLFVDGATGFVRMDAVASLAVASRVGGPDTTPTTV